MENTSALDVFAALSQATRLEAFRLIVSHEPGGLPAGEVARLLKVPQNTMSTHLAILARAGLIAAERQSRTVIYRPVMERVREIANFLVQDCCGGRPELCEPLIADFTPCCSPKEAAHVYNVMFLCTGNSARSILAEAVLNHLGQGHFRAYSAGSTPKGAVHPMTLDVLTRAGIATAGLRSKTWDEFAAEGAPHMDFVFTVCDNAAGETCPIWPGQPMTAHWGIEDPAAVDGPEFKQRAAFEDALRFMRNRIAAFANLPLASIDRMVLKSQLKSIGAMDGATVKSSDVA